jgi:Domain of unknown function (DU1801)
MEAKTKVSDASVAEFLNALDNETRRNDCQTLWQLMQAATGAEPKLWGSNIVGFGTYRLKYASGKEGDWPILAFAPRKQQVTLYLKGMDANVELLTRLGRHTRGGGCLHIKKLADVDLEAVKELLARSVALTLAESA